MKRIMSSFLLAFMMVMMLSNIVYANEVDESIDKKEWLISRGYDREILDELLDEDINMIYKRIQERMPKDVVVSSESMEWLKTFQDGTGLESRGAISTSQLQLRGVVTNFGTSAGDIIGCEVLILYDWLVTPGACEEDLVSLNWDSTCFTLSNFNAHSTVRNVSTGETEYFDFITTPHTAQNGGVGWYAKLRHPEISNKIQANPAGYAILFFEPAYPFKASDNLVKNFNVMYVHDKFPGVTSIGFSAGYGGASVGISYSPSDFAEQQKKTSIMTVMDVFIRCIAFIN